MGGSWLCHQNFFTKVEFIDARYTVVQAGKTGVIEFQRTEQTAGHDLLKTPNSICLKSRDFFYFHVDHLSGYEWNKTL